MFQENDNTSDNIGTNSDRYAEFVEQLKAAGFTPEQLQTINSAFTDCGLRVVATEAVCE